MAITTRHGSGMFVLLNLVLGALTFLVFLSTRRIILAPYHATLLNALACGILVGAVLGIILPEGFEAQQDGKEGWEASGLPILVGYAVQLCLESVGNLFGGHAHAHNHAVQPKHSPLPNAPLDDDDEEEEDVELDDGVECLGEEEEGKHQGKADAGRLFSASHISSSTDAGRPFTSNGEVVIELPHLNGAALPALSFDGPTAPAIAAVATAAARGERERISSSSVNKRSPHRHHRHPHNHHHLSIGSAEGLVDSPSPSSSAATAAERRGCCIFHPSFVGLLVHCLADGIALGASSLGTASLQGTVFSALLIHKLPVAFATGTWVTTTITAATKRPPHRQQQQQQPQQQQQQQQLQRVNTRLFLYHALAFSLASPVAAFLTHIVLQLQRRRHQHDESNSSRNVFVGQVLLFSGGTFLYVSVGHILPELMHSQQMAMGPIGRKGLVLLVVMVGMFAVPLLASLAPEDGH